MQNRKYIEQGYGEEFVWAGNWDDLYYGSVIKFFDYLSFVENYK